MAVSQANPIIVGRGFGGVVVRCDATPGAASYDDQGARFVFCPPKDVAGYRYAVDVERHGCVAPEHLMQYLGLAGDAFFWRWTQIEVTAKLRNIPILEVLKEEEYSFAQIDVVQVLADNHYISVGRSRQI